MTDVRDLLAQILMAVGVILAAIGAGVAFGAGAGLLVAGGLLVALSLLVGWRS